MMDQYIVYDFILSRFVEVCSVAQEIVLVCVPQVRESTVFSAVAGCRVLGLSNPVGWPC